MLLSILTSIPGLIAILVLLYQNWGVIIGWYDDICLTTVEKMKYHFGSFYNIDDAMFKPFIFYTNISGFTSYSTAGINTVYSMNATSLTSSTISSTNGQDLVFSNSSSQISLSQVAAAINEVRVARQEICELKVKYGKRIHELEEQLKEKK